MLFAMGATKRTKPRGSDSDAHREDRRHGGAVGALIATALFVGMLDGAYVAKIRGEEKRAVVAANLVEDRLYRIIRCDTGDMPNVPDCSTLADHDAKEAARVVIDGLEHMLLLRIAAQPIENEIRNTAERILASDTGEGCVREGRSAVLKKREEYKVALEKLLVELKYSLKEAVRVLKGLDLV